MDSEMFGNSSIITWLQYYNDNTDIDLEKVKIIDITRKNKNLIPTVESNDTVLVFTEAGHHDIFYRMWDVGLGECDVWYNVGSEPTGPICHNKVKEMIDRGINASAAMLIINPDARSTYKVGLKNSSFSKGSVQYVGSELRAVLLNKMHVSDKDTICVISGESIAIESAMIASEGQVIAVEYSARDRETLEENIDKFGIENVTIIDSVNEENLSGLAVPSLTMLVASASMEKEIKTLLAVNPSMEFVIYSLDFKLAADIPAMLSSLGIGDVEVIHVAVSRLTSKNTFADEPAPWIITGQA